MKAYSVRDKNSDYSTVVFAETSGKAKAIAIHKNACEDSYYTDIRTKRIPDLDKYYRGLDEMDWFDDADRIALVRDAGYSCDPECWEGEDCTRCPAKMSCKAISNPTAKAGGLP